MKKILFGTAVAAAAMLSACETLAPQDGAIEGTVQETERIILTATIGADTKTYLEWEDSVFKTRWAADDEIMIWDRDVDYVGATDYESYLSYAELLSGAGESKAEFAIIEDEGSGVLPENYVAVYGEVWPEETTGQWMAWLPRNQRREIYETKSGELIQGFDRFDYPMIAVGEGKSLNFKNICAVLKVSITGNGEVIKNVSLSTLDEGVYLAGDALLDLNSSRPTITLSKENVGEYDVDVYSEINFGTTIREYNEDGSWSGEEYDVLSDDPVECYIVLPAQTYPSGLKLSILTDKGMMEKQLQPSLVFQPSELRELPVFEYETNVSLESKWRLQYAWEESLPVFFEEEGDWLVIRNQELYGNYYLYFCNYKGVDSMYGWRNDYNFSTQLTNTCGIFEENGQAIDIRHKGYYDLYLDYRTSRLFIMTAGTKMTDIPTTDEVFCQDYYRIMNDIPDGAMIKVYGNVQAVYDGGFIMHLGSWGNAIQVYTYYASEEIKAQLAGLEKGVTLELYATKSTKNGLPQLKDPVWCKVYADDRYDYINSSYDITSEMDEYQSDHYSYIRYVGRLEISGNYYNVVVDGASLTQGAIHYPIQDLSGYNGKEVAVEGFYAGRTYSSNSGLYYIQTVLTDISLPDVGGSTEDVVPDEDIVISTR